MIEPVLSHNAGLAPQITQRITVLQGEVKVSADPAVEFTTVLGSCVCTCLFGPST